jgi:hypothetical protein
MVSKAQGRVFLLVEPATLKGGKVLYYPPKTSRCKLASRNWNIQFWNRNIQNLKCSRYRQNRTLRFVKTDCLVFHSSHLAF